MMKRSVLRKPSKQLVRTLSENICSLRRAKGLSQEELAAECGLHRTYIGSVERGERNVTLSTLEVLASALGVSVVELLEKPRIRMPMFSVDPAVYVAAIRAAGLSIYDPVEIGHPQLWIPTPILQTLLDRALSGVSLVGLPLRTRSKVVKEHVCRALGYPVPKVFRKTQPRFPGQQFDTYVQKSNNLQVWNEELAPSRRYVLIRVSSDDRILAVKVVSGDTLAKLDTTGTLTQKYQARCIPKENPTELVVDHDTERVKPYTNSAVDLSLAVTATPTDLPRAGELLPIAIVYERLCALVGNQFRNPGHDQERNRGAELHRLVCKALGYATFGDHGQFPDIRHQLLEVKLQTSPTIDLGLVRPDSEEPLDVPRLGSEPFRHCDVRYGIFCASIVVGEFVQLTHFFITTGEAFFARFPPFQGRVLNQKLQIPLPADFFGA